MQSGAFSPLEEIVMAYESDQEHPSPLRIVVLLAVGIFSVGMFLAAGAAVLSANMDHSRPLAASHAEVSSFVSLTSLIRPANPQDMPGWDHGRDEDAPAVRPGRPRIYQQRSTR